jgi:WD40 repeat protein
MILLKSYRAQGAVQSVAISADGEVIASASQDFTLRLWDSQGISLWQSQKYTGDPKAVTMSADGQIIASSGSDGSLYFLNREGREIGSYSSTGFVRAASMSPDGQIVVSGQGKTVCIWDRRGTSIGKSQEDGTAITALSISSTGKLIAVGNSSGNICLWNYQGEKLRQFQGHGSSIRAIAVSSIGQIIVSGSDDSAIHLWDQYGNLLKELQGHTSGIRGISISAEETVVSCSGDDTIRLWNYEGRQLGEFKHPGYVNTIAISADGKTIVSGSGIPGSRSSIFAVHLWDRQGNLLREHREHEDSVHAVAINADGQIVVSAGGTQIIQWNLIANKIQKFHVHTTSLHKNIWTVAISADGQRIVSGGWDGNLRLWDQQGNQVGIFQGHNKPINAVAISSDGQMTVTGGQDGCLGLWRSNWQSWLQICCTCLTYHLISENPELEITVNEPETILGSGDPAITATQKACAACQKYVWNDVDRRIELAQILRRQGYDLARLGKSERAVAKLRQAAVYDSSLLPELEQFEKDLAE